MSNRLDELRRQRALVQEHLAWLDREIAAAESEKRATTAPATNSTVVPVPKETEDVTPIATTTAASVSGAVPANAGTDMAAERILREYRVAPDAVRQDVRKGCFLYFAAAFFLFALTVVGLYFALRSH